MVNIGYTSKKINKISKKLNYTIIYHKELDGDTKQLLSELKFDIDKLKKGHAFELRKVKRFINQ